MNQKRTTYLSGRFFVVFVGLQFLGFLSFLYERFLPLYILSHGLFLLVLITDFFNRGTDLLFFIEGKSPKEIELDEFFEIQFTLKSQSVVKKAIYHPSLFFPESHNLEWPKENFPLEDILVDQQAGELIYKGNINLRARALGVEQIHDLTVYHQSLMGFFKILLKVPLLPELKVRVIPTKRQLSEQSFQDLIKDQRLFIQGTRKQLRGGLPEQFHSIREYRYPDPLKYLDAKKTAKYQRPMTRVYDSFFQHHLIIGLDVGRNLLGDLGLSRKYDYYLAAVLALAQNALASSDRVSLFAFSQKNRYSIREAKNFTPFQSLFDGQSELKPLEEESDYQILSETVSRYKGGRSLFVIFTDASRRSVQKNLLKQLPLVTKRHLTVVISLVDSSFVLESLLTQNNQLKPSLENYSDLLYAYRLNETKKSFQQQASSLGAGVLFIREQDWLSVILHVYELLRASVAI